MPLISRTLTLEDLPVPPQGKKGWPWTEQTNFSSDILSNTSDWPRISIVTPSYNQGQFIEETIRSVLLQGYPNLEYIIIDGGSTDNTLEIINKYEKYISYWVSEPDDGQADAINKGFSIVTGNLVGWQNSDDFYYPNAFTHVVNAANIYPEYDVFYGSRFYLNLEGDGVLSEDSHKSPFNLEEMIPNANMANQSLFFKSRIFKEGNFLDKSFQHCMDHEFFWRLIFKEYKFIYIPEIKGCYRLHPDCKGKQYKNYWLVDTLKICKTIYQHTELPYSVRKQSWQFLRGNCLDDYGKLRLESFRENFCKLVYLGGVNSLDLELIIKYITSFVGKKRLTELRKLKFMYK